MDNKENEWVAGYDAAISDLAAFVKSRRFAANPLEDDGTIGSRVRAAREKSGLSQAGLAAQMVNRGTKWSQGTVWATEADERKLPASEITTLALSLGVSPLYLLGEQA